MSNVYLITGASSDVGCALIRRLWQPGDLFIAQGAGDLGGLAELCKEHPGTIRTYDVDLTNEKALETFNLHRRRAGQLPRPHPLRASARFAGGEHQVQEVRRGTL